MIQILVDNCEAQWAHDVTFLEMTITIFYSYTYKEICDNICAYMNIRNDLEKDDILYLIGKKLRRPIV